MRTRRNEKEETRGGEGGKRSIAPRTLTAATVSPAPVVPRPVVTTDRAASRAANFMIWDLPVQVVVEIKF